MKMSKNLKIIYKLLFNKKDSEIIFVNRKIIPSDGDTITIHDKENKYKAVATWKVYPIKAFIPDKDNY